MPLIFHGRGGKALGTPADHGGAGGNRQRQIARPDTTAILAIYDHGVNLDSAWAKLHHAERHIDDLDRRIGVCLADGRPRPRFRAELDLASGFHVVRIASTPDLAPLTVEVSLALGDVVHDLRSGLDHLAWQLASKFAGGVPARPRQVYFPICDSSGKERHQDPSYFDPADWRQLHEFQPCKGVNGRPDRWSGEYVHQLWLLQEMSNVDKHRSLSVVLLTSNAISLIPTRQDLPPWLVKTEEGFSVDPERMLDPDPNADEINTEHADMLVEVGAEVARVRAPAWQDRPSIEEVGEVTPRVALEGLRPAIPTVRR
jgi:hypothetical protein